MNRVALVCVALMGCGGEAFTSADALDAGEVLDAPAVDVAQSDDASSSSIDASDAGDVDAPSTTTDDAADASADTAPDAPPVALCCDFENGPITCGGSNGLYTCGDDEHLCTLGCNVGDVCEWSSNVRHVEPCP